MIARRIASVEIDGAQFRLPDDMDAAFLDKFARQRSGHRFAGLHAAAREIEARHICMTHQHDPVVGVDHQAAHAQRHRPVKERREGDHAMQQPRPRRRRSWIGWRGGEGG